MQLQQKNPLKVYFQNDIVISVWCLDTSWKRICFQVNNKNGCLLFDNFTLLMFSMKFMKKLIFLLLLLTVHIGNLYARKTPAFIYRLLHEEKEITYILNRPNKILPDSLIPVFLTDNIHSLYKNSKHLYVSVEGTGWLYEVTDDNGELKLNRVDSTFYVGYNFADLRFTWKGLPHSFGGYGFWKTNGILRKYDVANHGWKVVLLNQELVTSFDEHKSIVQFDTSQHQIAFFNPVGVNDAITTTGEEFEKLKNTIWLLDYNSGNWNKLGFVEKKQVFFVGATPWGSFCRMDFNKSMALVDLIRNRVYTIKPTAFNNYYEKIGNTIPYAAYFADSCLYFSDLNFNKLDSLQMKRADFEETGIPFYTEDKRDTMSSYWYLLVLLFFPAAYIFKKRFASRKPLEADKEKEINDAPMKMMVDSQEHFSELEKSLLKLLLLKYSQNKMATIEDLNKILGLNAKNESVQKKIRSESLNQLNQKLQLLCHSNEEAIIKHRSNFDKRSFEYQINPQLIEMIEKMGIV